ncbi:MAG: competence/damage-inducible protein A [Sedimentisphaerales bacterium]|nr:competence/damage-inducible protein A [Sedimentisphaerales bacterium]
MKKASIVSIGNELLSGETTDTNTAYLSRELLSIGMPVVSFYTVGDEIAAIVRALRLAGDDADVVLATGGLGPTDDDVTRQAFAELLGAELQMENELLERMQVFFARRGLEMPEKNSIQAYIPVGAKSLANNTGTAAGIMAKAKSKVFFAMPGVPSEMTQMFRESVLPEVRPLAPSQTVVVRKVRCCGAGESTIAGILGELMQRGRNPLINCTAESGIITLHVIAKAESEAAGQQMAEDDEKLLRDALGKLVYGTGEQTLAEVVGLELARLGKTIAVAESCTGGLAAKLLTDASGASNYFTHGWVTYSNGAKTSLLGVPKGLIDRCGAVSEEVARAMAEGARLKACSDYAIGITGIAGPGGGTEQKPVGLVYICVDSSGQSDVSRCQLSGPRESVRLRAAQTALNLLRLQLMY